MQNSQTLDHDLFYRMHSVLVEGALCYVFLFLVALAEVTFDVYTVYLLFQETCFLDWNAARFRQMMVHSWRRAPNWLLK